MARARLAATSGRGYNAGAMSESHDPAAPGGGPDDLPAGLRKKAAGFPDAPGVYFMKDAKGVTLYVGKAKSLRGRVSSYFQPSAEHVEKNRAMVEKVRDIEFLLAPSEVDALLMEARLIKDIQPRYNVNLKDDKSFPLLAISQGEDFPRVEVTRERDEARFQYYGPFANAHDLRAALKILQSIFRFRTCTLNIAEGDERRRHFRPCLLWNIGMCTAPCAAKIGREAYAEDVRALKKLLGGKRAELLGELRDKMEAAASERRYEAAAGFRDQIRAVEGLQKKAKFGEIYTGDLTPLDPLATTTSLQEILELDRLPRTIEGTDISCLSGKEAVGSLVSFIDGQPFKSGYRRFRIRTVADTDDYGMMREVVRRRFTRLARDGQSFPEVLLLDGGVGHLNSVLEEFRVLGLEPPLTLALAKHDGDHLFRQGVEGRLEIDRRAPGFRLLQRVRDESHRFAQHYHHILRRKKVLEEE